MPAVIETARTCEQALKENLGEPVGETYWYEAERAFRIQKDIRLVEAIIG